MWAQQLDVLLLRVAAFSGGSFRYLVGECERSAEPSKSNVMQKSRTQSNSRIFREPSALEKGDSGISGLVTAIEVRLLLFAKPSDYCFSLLERTILSNILCLIRMA